MRFTEIISESVSPRLKDIAKIATNMQDADFWLVRKGSDKTVGKPVKEFDPSRIGVKVVRTDVLDPKYLYYVMMNLHNQGHFARIANGTTNLVNIRVEDIANIPLGQQDMTEESKGLWANIHAKQNRIKHGSGEKMRKPGSKGAPSAQNFKDAANEAANPAQQAAIAINMKKHHQKPKNKGLAEESLNEFAPRNGDDREPDEEEILKQLAAQWWLGTEQQMAKAQKTLAAMGWDIGQDESGDDDAGVFLIRAGDDNGDSYIAFNHSDLELNEGETWSKHNNPRAGGMSKKSVSSYRRSHPGSKIQTAVTTKPSKLKKGSKAAKRRKSFCARMKGMKKSRTSAKTARDPNSNINKSLRRWNCESIEQMEELLMLAEQMVAKARKEIL
jgi:hypothetical protein